jgi:NACHT domain
MSRKRDVLIICAAIGVGLITLASVLFGWGIISQLTSSGVTVITVITSIYALTDRGKGERGGKKSALDEFADELADFVQNEWQDEAQARDLENSPVISWEPVSADLADAKADPEHAASLLVQSEPMELGKAGAVLRDLLDQVPSHKLLVLGEPGTGKTVLLISLLLELLEKRKAEKEKTGGAESLRVPVLLPLGSWDPSARDLTSWLIDQLHIHYPSLRNPVTTDEPDRSVAKVLVKENRLILILDGLDEIPERYQGRAIREINRFLLPGTRLILSSRVEPYKKAVKHGGSTRVQLRDAAGIRLCYLDRLTVKNFILHNMFLGPDDGVPEEWRAVFDSIGEDNPIGKTLRTPLMVGLACAIYNTQFDDVDDEVDGDDHRNSPDYLCTLDSPEAIEKHLLSAFVKASYRPRQGEKNLPWPGTEAQRWLSFVAKHLQEKGRPNLAWWELREAVPSWLPPVTVGVVSALAAGVAAALGGHVGRGIGIGLGLGMLVGLAIAVLPGEILARYIRKNNPPRSYPLVSEPGGKTHFWKPPYFWERRPVGGIATGLIGAVLGALGAGYAGKMGIGHALWPFGGLSVAMGVGLGAGSTASVYTGLPAGLIGGFIAGLVENVGVGIPAAIVNGIGVGMTVAVIVIFVGRTAPALKVGWNPSGVFGGLAIGAAVGLLAARVLGPKLGLTMGFVIGIAAAWPLGQVPTKPDFGTVADPHHALRRDYHTFWITGLAAGIAAASAGFVGGSLVSAFALKVHPHLDAVIKDGLDIGLAAGVVVGLTVGFYHAASGSFFLTRAWLTLTGHLPWHLMDFLVDAKEVRGVLRQSGAYYQFRHLKLQEELARHYDSTSPQAGEPPSTQQPDPVPSRRSRRTARGTVAAHPAFGPALRPSRYLSSRG